MTVTKFLGQAANDVTVTKFLDGTANDTSVTKFLDNVVGKFLMSNDITVTKFLESEDGIAVTKYLQSNDITVTKFLNEVVPAYLEENGVDMGWYLDTTVTKFLDDHNVNDISVTKFLDQRANDVTVTKFLHSSGGSNDITVTKFLDDAIASYLDTTVTKFLNNDISVTKFLAQAQLLAFQPKMLKPRCPAVLSGITKGVDVIVAFVTPVLKRNTQLEGTLHCRYKVLLLDLQQFVQRLQRWNGCLTDAYGADFIGLDERHVQRFTEQFGDRCCRHPSRGTASGNHNFVYFLMLHFLLLSFFWRQSRHPYDY